MDSGLPEFFDAGLHGSAGGPDVVKEDVGSIGSNDGVWGYSIGVACLGYTGSAIGADLSGVTGADKK